ncbi:MAG: hypothetical protein KGL04_09940 [Elusimicrobia bacterium]|nr:hypothetical protein [Elusimicrobiota bacterium]MDE2314475.1 hypothetical protein [Elusimicrobiota bacterium]
MKKHISRTAAAGLAVLMAAGAAGAAPLEPVDAAANFSAVDSPAAEALAGVEIGRITLGDRISAGLSSAMSEDFAQTEALPPSSPDLLPISLKRAAVPPGSARAAEKGEKAPSHADASEPSTERGRSTRRKERKAMASPMTDAARLAREIRKSAPGGRGEKLDSFYDGGDGGAGLRRAIQKDKDWISVGVNAASVARVLSEADRPETAIELARRGLRAPNHITAEYTAMALGQIAQIKGMRRHADKIASLYRLALRKKDVDVRRYAAQYLDLFAKAFLKTHPKMVAEVFRMALRDKDDYVHGYALQNLEEFPGLRRSLARSIKRTRDGN